jgi:hypothetical protein
MATDSDEGRIATPAASLSRRKGKGDERDVGAALRSAYQKTVEEAVPDDLLDLLGKLN